MEPGGISVLTRSARTNTHDSERYDTRLVLPVTCPSELQEAHVSSGSLAGMGNTLLHKRLRGALTGLELALLVGWSKESW